MKMKMDFVTNSSSTCYIFESCNKIYKKDLPSCLFNSWDRLRTFDSKEKLISHTQGEPCDWIDFARGIPRFYQELSTSSFENLMSIILKDKKAIMAHMDRDHIYEIEDEFLDKMKELGATLQSTESY